MRTLDEAEAEAIANGWEILKPEIIFQSCDEIRALFRIVRSSKAGLMKVTHCEEVYDMKKPDDSRCKLACIEWVSYRIRYKCAKYQGVYCTGFEQDRNNCPEWR
ncbi:MAG: hypothetical protein SVM80_12295 [Halobacteriota archaeon]|nr:hypothetical protein [Halobacteriota archaeon]